jgi:amino acid permease
MFPFELTMALAPRRSFHFPNVGSGLFIATGKALVQGDPGSMFLGYLIVCIGVWANLQILTEMTIAFPTSGNYIDYADRWVDPALAFGAGFAEWLGESIVPSYILWSVHGLSLYVRVDVCFRC